MVSVALGTILKEYLSLLTHPGSREECLELLSSSVTGGEGREGNGRNRGGREGRERGRGEKERRERGDGREVKYRKEDRGREEVNRECV